MKTTLWVRFKQMSVFKKTGTILGLLVILIIGLIFIGIAGAPDYTSEMTPAGIPVNTTHYLPLDDRTNVFISVWLPQELEKGEKIPTLIKSSR